MTTVQFLDRLRRLDVRIWIEGGKLRFRAPGGLSEELRAELTARKGELLLFLGQMSQAVFARPPLVRASRAAPIPPTFAQQRLWFLDQWQPGVPNYNVCDSIQIKHAIDVAALQRAVTQLVRRHEVLRTSFPAVGGIPTQLIGHAGEVPLPIFDLTDLPEEQRLAQAQRLSSEEACKPFNLATGPLLRVALIRINPTHYVWLLSVHHIVSDDWSKKLINQELETLYNACADGQPTPLPELPLQWADFAAWQTQWLHGEVLDSYLKYWTEQLSGQLPVLNLPKDRSGRVPARGRGGMFWFPRQLSLAIRALSKAEGATLFMTLLAGYAALLARYTRQDDIIIGSPISDRGQIETEGLIGFLLNTLPLRLRVNPQASFRELLRQAVEVCLGAYAHQEVPYESLMQHLSVARDNSGNPLFRTMLVLLNTPPAKRGSHAQSHALWDEAADLQQIFASENIDDGLYIEERTNGTTKFDLSISFIEHGDELWGKTEYDADMFRGDATALLMQRLQTLLQSAAADPDCKVAELEILTKQQHELLDEWSRGPCLAFGVSTLQQLFERQAALYPTRIALEGESRSCLTYAGLNRRANQLAAVLRRRGVAPETRVGIFIERSVEMFVAVLAVLKSGACYVPLDTSCPESRLNLIIEDAHIELLVTLEPMLAALPAFTGDALCLDRDAAQIDCADSSDAGSGAAGDNLACVLYTSGSTGRPKGVMLTHSGLVNYLEDTVRAYPIGADDRILQFASIAFDASLEESFLAFATGATLVLRPERMLDSIAAFVAYCHELQLTTLVLPVVYWQELVANLDALELPTSLRRIIVGGERVAPDKLARWHAHIAGRIGFFNTYGPTEASISVTRDHAQALADTESVDAEVSIGKPVANCTVHILDQWMQQVPAGVPGEIYLGGSSVARGYLGKPGMTADKFVPDPFSAEHGARLYRTGDLARWLPDGTLQYRGRVDDQVKIRGYRIEPSEIAVVLQEHATVKDVVVTVREDEPGEKRLVAYVVPHEGSALDSAQLRSYLRPRLPSYMMPAVFVPLAALPMDLHGKVSHQALPAPDSARAGVAIDEQRELARSSTEIALSTIWTAVLKLERIGVDENFFDLGGHSLLATQVVARVNDTLRIDLPLRRLFEAPTIAELAAIVDDVIATTGGTPEGAATAASGSLSEAQLVASMDTLSEQEIELLLQRDQEEHGEFLNH